MGLTYPGAEAFVESIHVALRAIFPAIPPCLLAYDEPSGDFGIAHFYGLVDDPAMPSMAGMRCAASLTFDNDRVPLRYVVTHELGHAVSASVRIARGGNFSGFDDGLYGEFWAARGWVGTTAPATAMDAQLIAIAKEKVALNSGYRDWPEENFADTFGVVNTPFAFPITEQWGVYLDQPKMLDFYKSLKGEDFMAQSDIDAAVAASLASFGLDAATFQLIKDDLADEAHHDHGVLAPNGSLTDLKLTEPRFKPR